MMFFIHLNFLRTYINYESIENANKDELTNIIESCHENTILDIEEVLKDEKLNDEHKTKLNEMLEKHKKFSILDIFGENNNEIETIELARHLEELADVIGEVRSEMDGNTEMEKVKDILQQTSLTIGQESKAVKEYPNKEQQRNA
ncbi:hypothetical protein NBO_73g0013 [Nosema bombycis CQ1]|uniref:Uncharacterized protein n=1 Tax=Nosema bombycis (strain CQ1 / CVCC 102059) TaxID=578461 RepID=R0KT99_NOSB1|nr:hypothetical protein NBO_73g0013 [Nosema bombycis CQ1]|eukprot:EOB13447.1 hypothetical protein NBO_73g0013 [Nosema bombycis CQ1]